MQSWAVSDSAGGNWMSWEPFAASDGKDDSFVTVSVNSVLSPEQPINNGEKREDFSWLKVSICRGMLSCLSCKIPSFTEVWCWMLLGVHIYVRDVVQYNACTLLDVGFWQVVKWLFFFMCSADFCQLCSQDCQQRLHKQDIFCHIEASFSALSNNETLPLT